MANKYRPGQLDFYSMGAANQIYETQYGTDLAGTVYYPGVSTCTTLTLLLADGSMIGAHFTKLDAAATVDAILAQMNVVRAGRAVTQIYLVGVLRARGSGFMSDARFAWPTQITTFNQAFGRPAGALCQGFIQPEGSDMHYKGMAGGAAAMMWFQKPSSAGGIADGKWDSITMSSL